MLKLVNTFRKKDSIIKAAAILAFVIIAVYSPIVFLDQSYNETTPIPPEFSGL